MQSIDEAGSGLVTAPVSGIDPCVNPDDPMMGTWLADLGRSRPERARSVATPMRYGALPPMRRTLGRWRFTPEGQGVRLQQFADMDPESADAASIDFFSTWDGRPWADPQGPAYLGELVQHWRLDARLVVRLVLDNVAPPERREWMICAVSTTGTLLAVTAWRNAEPAARDLCVFKRHGIADVLRGGSCGRSAQTSGTDDIAGRLFSGRWHEEPENPLDLQSEVHFALEAGELTERRFVDPRAPAVALINHRSDGQPHQDVEDATTTSWWIDPHLLVRKKIIESERTTWSVYAVANDQTKMVITGWDETNPAAQAITRLSKAELS